MPTPRVAVNKLQLSSKLKELVGKVIRTERARATVFGSWNTPVSSSTIPPDTVGCNRSQNHTGLPSLDQRASINLLAGTSGSGKKTVAKAIAFELGNKKIKYIHVGDFLGGTMSEITTMFKVLL
jgi:hypothetical protein